MNAIRTTFFLWALSVPLFAAAADDRKVLVISGFAEEGRLVSASPEVVSVLSGGSLTLLEQRLAAIDPSTIKAVISFGVAGALHPNLVPGDLVVSKEVINDQSQTFSTAKEIRFAVLKSLRGRHLRVFGGTMVGSPVDHFSAQSKEQLYAATKAMSVDMESEAAAAYAFAHSLPLGVIRSISDAQNFSLPPLVRTALNPDGSLNLGAVLKGIFEDPSQIGPLIQAGFDSAKAFSSLKKARELIDFGSF